MKFSKFALLALIWTYGPITMGAEVGEKGVYWVQGTDTQPTSVIVDWCKRFGSACVSPDGKQIDLKIDSTDQVVVKVTNFNYINFDLTIEITEKEVETYKFLSNLWDELLGFDLGDVSISGSGIRGQTTSSGATEDPVVTWWKAIRKDRQTLKETAEGYSKDYLSSTDRDNLVTDRENRADANAKLQKLRDLAFQAAVTVEDLQKFDIVDKEHSDQVQANLLFVGLAKKSLDGESTLVRKKDAGTLVSAAINSTPKESGSEGSESRQVSVSYFVQSELPLVFHVGLTYADTDKVELEKVRALDGRDLFSEVSSDSGETGLSAFLSYPIGQAESDYFVTLGTDVEDLGERLHVGLSWRFRQNWMATFGGSYQKTQAGEMEVQDTNMDQTSTRTLFEIAKEEREWAPFVSISVKLY